MQLTRVTTQYSSEEDRFRLLGTTPEEDTLALWITQRLFIRVIKVLLDWLDKTQTPDDVPSRHANDPEVKSSMQNFAQQHANAALEPSLPVEAASETRQWLINEIDIQQGEEHVALVFKLPDGNKAEVPFDATQLRQWLNIVLDQWTVAEWPESVWPRWIREAKSATGAAAKSSFH